MRELYRRYRVWMPWVWLPISIFLGSLYAAAGIFFVERKLKAALAGAAGTGATSTEWAPAPAKATQGKAPEVVEVFPKVRAATAAEAHEAEVAEAEEACVKAGR